MPLPLLGVFKYIWVSLPWLGVFKYLIQCHCTGWEYLYQKWWSDIMWLTDTRTQPFIGLCSPNLWCHWPFEVYYNSKLQNQSVLIYFLHVLQSFFREMNIQVTQVFLSHVNLTNIKHQLLRHYLIYVSISTGRSLRFTACHLCSYQDDHKCTRLCF